MLSRGDGSMTFWWVSWATWRRSWATVAKRVNGLRPLKRSVLTAADNHRSF